MQYMAFCKTIRMKHAAMLQETAVTDRQKVILTAA